LRLKGVILSEAEGSVETGEFQNYRGRFRMSRGLVFSIIVMLAVCGVALAVNGDMGASTEALTDGSETYPYLIEDLADFDTFANAANAATYWTAGVHTKLMTNIDLSGRTYTKAVIAPDTSNSNSGFQGIEFSGVFNGNTYIVSNLTINNGSSRFPADYVGLFGFLHGGRIQSLGLENANVTGGGCVGGLCGWNKEGTISDSYSTGNVTGEIGVGGLCGGTYYGENNPVINNCYAISNVTGEESIGGLCGQNFGLISDSKTIGDVTGEGYYTGGLCGVNRNTINNSYAAGNVTGGNSVGGLCGNNGGAVNNSYAASNVSGEYSVGGLCGDGNGTISNSYAVSSVTGYSSVGGLCGENGGTTDNSYAVGKVSGEIRVGGLCGGKAAGSVTLSFWNVEVSGIDVSLGGTGKTTVEMMTQSTFAGWDFTTPVWMMLRPGEDYPRLAWQAVFDGDIAGLYGVDMVDFAYLANYWGQDCDSPACDRADIDTSGTIDLPDLAAIATDWLK
jgi:hypothetical protein